MAEPLPESLSDTGPIAAPEPVIPAQLWIDELNAAPFHELMERAEALGVKINPEKTRHNIVFDLLRALSARGTELFADGILEIAPQGSGYMRWPRFNFSPLPQDVFVSPQIERNFFLRNGNRVTGRIRPPRDRERFMTLDRLETVEGIPAGEWKENTEFEKLTALNPRERIVLENPKSYSVTTRAIDLIAPLGRGQRGLIVAPPRTGKTVMLKEIAQAIRVNSPDTSPDPAPCG